MKIRFITAALLIAALTPSAASAQDWWNGDWSERRKVTLDAASMRAVAEEVKRAPVLVRLHSGVLDFTKVKPDGSDLRFVGSDGETPLNYHIERFDPAAEIGLVWVDVPAVAPGASQDIWLYYGSQAAKPAANSGATYDGEQVLVQHLSENGTPLDATANRNQVTASTARPTVEGLIGGGASFVSDSQIRLAPSQSLAVPANGGLTFTGWVKPATQGMPADAAIFTKLGSGGEGGPRLVLGLRNSVPYARLVGADGTPAEVAAGAPLAGGSWAHVAVTAGGGTLTLYVNGVAVGSTQAALPELAGEDIFGAAAGLPAMVGDMDEIGRANVVRSASMIGLLAQSQNRGSNFVDVAGEAESEGSGGHNYFGILFSALTFDAWIVIAILGVMAAISWAVMVMKGMLIGRTASANAAFLGSYQNATRGQSAHSGLTSGALGASQPDASLARLFTIGQQELKSRLDEAPTVPVGGLHAVAPQSIAAIRSALDAGQAREEQKLNRWMVLLTIAISGGPFLGLLGTVVGVMITFAGVAAAGDVNINAIAPGIAAALLATVAGLAVAIPALFGYNYLQSRLEEISTDNQIFVDELEKRIAETYRPGARALAAE
ncbi:MAG TPA: DUF2341 domain-containing protein [Sphingomonadaceae bacterium]|nr:DUF2341 domain-containing protein [Sphingomonadaceae bacterium]